MSLYYDIKHMCFVDKHMCCVDKKSDTYMCFHLAMNVFAWLCTDPSDYIGGVVTVTFRPGEKARMVTFTVMNDEYAECIEQFLASLGIPEYSTAVGVVRGELDMVTVDISDNDDIICSVDGSDSTVTVDEGAGAVNVSVSCSGKSSNRFTVQVQTTDGSATGGSCDSHMTFYVANHWRYVCGIFSLIV